MDPSIDTIFILVAGLPAEPLPTSKTLFVAMGILSVVAVN
jgi:hypothetical protein